MEKLENKSLLEKAIALACKVHADQTDKAGQPYILHPLRLMLRFSNDNERIVAVLHDVIEDGNITLSDLINMQFSTDVVDAVDSLTKRPGESYENFITRASLNTLSRKVKIEDIKDNLDLSRMSELQESDLTRVKKYHDALRFLRKI